MESTDVIRNFRTFILSKYKNEIKSKNKCQKKNWMMRMVYLFTFSDAVWTMLYERCCIDNLLINFRNLFVVYAFNTFWIKSSKKTLKKQLVSVVDHQHRSKRNFRYVWLCSKLTKVAFEITLILFNSWVVLFFHSFIYYQIVNQNEHQIKH